MTIEQAVELIRPAVAGGRRWADLGAGRGAFTRALAELLDESSTIVSVDRDPSAVAALRRLAMNGSGGAKIVPASGDLRDLEACEALTTRQLDGALIANALHYLGDPVPPLSALGRLVRPGGRIVVVEYERRRANPWVPHPLPANRLAAAVRRAGLSGLEVVSTRPSAYGRTLYCAVSTVPGRVDQR